MAMTSQITNLVIMLFFTQLSKRIPTDDPNVLNGIRALYILSNLIILGINLFIQKKINDKRDMTVLKYVEPAPVGSQEPPKPVSTTVHAYDLSQLKTVFKGQMMGVGMMAVMHLYFKYTNPLMIQSIIPLKGALETNLAKIHLLGNSASGDLKRPWKVGGGLAGILAGQGQGGDGGIKTDKASFEAAERQARGGVKDE